VREAVYGSLYFSVFEQLKRGAAWTLDSPQEASRGTGTSQGLPFAVLLLCGGCTGAVVWTFMFPIDVVSWLPVSNFTNRSLSLSLRQVKSKMQAARERRGPGAWAVAARHWRAEGAAGFFKGWSAAMVRSLPAHAVVLATYTTIMQLLL
jgi:hypothetical protein